MVPLLSATAGAFVSGCAAEAGGDGTGDVSTEVLSDLAAGTSAAAPADGLVPKAASWFEHSTALNGKWVAPTNTHVCVLTGVQGNFSDYDLGRVELNWPENSYWTLWSNSYSTGYAVCASWGNFIAPSGSGLSVSAGAHAMINGNADATAEANAWRGDSMTFLRGVDGELQGTGEYVQTIQATTIPTYSKLRTHSEVGSFLDYTVLHGYSHSILVGVPQTRLVRLMGYNTAGNMVRSTISAAGTFEFAVSNVSGFSGYWLSTVDQGLCSFTHISGNFDGGGEWARINSNGGQWFLKASGAAGKGVYARARCMAYDQR